jgi:hypothetical protein
MKVLSTRFVVELRYSVAYHFQNAIKMLFEIKFNKYHSASFQYFCWIKYTRIDIIEWSFNILSMNNEHIYMKLFLSVWWTYLSRNFQMILFSSVNYFLWRLSQLSFFKDLISHSHILMNITLFFWMNIQ